MNDIQAKQNQPPVMSIVTMASLFPHTGEPSLGIFVANRLFNFLKDEPSIKASVIAPVPWFPVTWKMFGRYARSAQAPDFEHFNDISVVHPKYCVLPKIGMRLLRPMLERCYHKALSKLIASGHRVDLLDGHYLFPDGVAVANTAKKFNLPYVLTARGSDVTEICRDYPWARQEVLESIKNAAAVITVGSGLKRELLSYGVRDDKIHTLRNGVDLQKFCITDKYFLKTDIKNALGIKHTLLVAGWLIDRKRPDLVLDVLEHLTSCRLLFAGDGPLRTALEKRVKKSPLLAGRVDFLGQVAPDDMPALYSAVDVLLLLSDREGWANVLLESMACGTPVVSRDVGSAVDLISDDVAGRVIDSDDPIAIAKITSEVLVNMPLAHDVRAFAKKFDWKETSRRQAELFQKALN